MPLRVAARIPRERAHPRDRSFFGVHGRRWRGGRRSLPQGSKDDRQREVADECNAALAVGRRHPQHEREKEQVERDSGDDDLARRAHDVARYSALKENELCAARPRPPEASNVVPMPGAAKAPAQPEQVDAKTVAKIDPQAERAALVARLESALMDRYIIKRAPVTMGDVTIGRTEYRFRGDTSRVAFTESTFRLATDTNSPSVARSMVDVAEARNWKALRVSGNEDFKRMVWLEASVRGVKTLGYEPNPGDLEVLKREREARQVNRIEPARDASSSAAAAPAEKTSARGGGGRKAVLAAIEAVLVAKKVPEKHRAAVMAAATEKLAQRIRDGQVPKVKVYDRAAPSQRPVVVPTPEMQRSRDRAAPAPVR